MKINTISFNTTTTQKPRIKPVTEIYKKLIDKGDKKMIEKKGGGGGEVRNEMIQKVWNLSLNRTPWGQWWWKAVWHQKEYREVIDCGSDIFDSRESAIVNFKEFIANENLDKDGWSVIA